ncbi:MAG: glycerol-3-phosphate 1-O-acyltransferase PlsY [Candidatus Latescibacteria bacterium]|nr:glycerol-3-phosphate 1-O-acyltransferase PlsY [Candidatus Latescibacterota bacterium]
MNLLFFSPVENNTLTVYFYSLLVGYLLGSIPFGFLIARLKGIDIRNFGSRNIGFNNVRRAVGIKFAIPVLILDIAKGFVPTFFASELGAVGVLVGLGSILGHSFTPWLGFRGGKGVATTIGVMLALMPLGLATGIGVFIIALVSFSYISLASIFFALSLPVSVALLYRPASTRLIFSNRGENEIFLLIFTIIIALIIVIRHKDNINRIIKKTEPKVMISKYLQGKR